MEKLNIATPPVTNDVSFGGSQNGTLDKKQGEEDDFNEVTSQNDHQEELPVERPTR